jgi:hypothetical protein
MSGHIQSVPDHVRFIQAMLSLAHSTASLPTISLSPRGTGVDHQPHMQWSSKLAGYYSVETGTGRQESYILTSHNRHLSARK